MSTYRQGAVLGLTIAEIFILLTFLLLIATLGLVQSEDSPPEPDTTNTPQVWEQSDEIETLTEQVRKAQKEAEEMRKAQEQTEQELIAAEQERDQAQKEAEETRKAQEQAEQERIAAEQERDQAQKEAEETRKAQEQTEQELIAAEQERDQAQKEAEETRKAQEQAEQERIAAEQERDQARDDLEVQRLKGNNPPCWYKVVSAGNGKTREKPYYAFNVAIHKDSIELAPRLPPPGGASDDGGGVYADEWKRLQIEKLPYGQALNEDEFIEAVSGLVAQGRNRQVRTYECVFSVMVWDKTPDHAKKRWKDAHDRIIEGLFSAYTVQDLEWKGAD